MHHAESLRLRLLALLSIYDLLPYSLSRPPCGSPPLTLQEASTPKAVAACLQALMMNQDKIPTHIRANVFVSHIFYLFSKVCHHELTVIPQDLVNQLRQAGAV